MGIGLETIIETEIEQEECDAKWNRTGIRAGVRGTPLFHLGSRFLSIFVLFYFCSPLSAHMASLGLRAVLG